jgi:hypothetical protein
MPTTPLACWNPDQQKLLQDAVLDAFNLDELRQAIFYGMNQKLERHVQISDPFETVVFHWLELVQRIGWNEDFVRAVYAWRPQNRLVLAFCQAHAQYVFSPTPKQQAVNVVAGISGLGQGMAPGAVRDRLQEVAEQSAATLGFIDRMGRYKQLHEILHTLNSSLCYELSRSVGVFRSDPGRFQTTTTEIRQFRKYCGDLENYAAEATRAAGSLPADEKENQGVWIEHLTLAATAMRRGLDTGDQAAADTGLGILLGTLDREPGQINRQIVELARDLDLTAFAAQLQKVAGAIPPDDPRSPLFAASVRDLSNLAPQVVALVAEHDGWQQLDNPLGMVSRVPSYLLTMWPQIRRLGRRLIEAHSTAGWAAELTETISRYENAPNPTARDFAFDDILQVASRRFREVDDELLDLSTALGHIATAFKTVLGGAPQ